MDAFSASHAAAAAAAKAAAEQSAASAAAAAAAAAAWPSPSAAAFAAAVASHAATISATAARVVASNEATIASFARWSACRARSAAAAAAAEADRAALAESWPELVWHDSEADSMPPSPSESCKAVWADNLDDSAWGHFLDDCKFEDDQGVTSEYCGVSDSDLAYFGFGNNNLNDTHCNMETSQIVTRLSEISMEDRLNQDSERQRTGCSMGASTYCFK